MPFQLLARLPKRFLLPTALGGELLRLGCQAFAGAPQCFRSLLLLRHGRGQSSFDVLVGLLERLYLFLVVCPLIGPNAFERIGGVMTGLLRGATGQFMLAQLGVILFALAPGRTGPRLF